MTIQLHGKEYVEPWYGGLLTEVEADRLFSGKQV